MAGTLNVDTLKADSNLKLQIASANVAFIDANGLTIVGNSLNVGGGRIVVTSNNSISTPSVIGANLVTVSGTTALGITANGQITTANAPFILTGGQLQFPATQIASGDANCLDDYEEGTWTPTYFGSSTAGTTTYNNQKGTYVKIGNSVYCECYLDWSAKTGTGDGLVGGLPVAVGAYSIDSRPLFYIGAYSGYSITGTLSGIVVNAGTSILLYVNNNGSLAGSAIQNSGLMRFQFWYRSAN